MRQPTRQLASALAAAVAAAWLLAAACLPAVGEGGRIPFRPGVSIFEPNQNALIV